MAEKVAKYAKIKVFDPLIKIDLFVSPGNHFKWLLLYFTSLFVMLEDQKGPEYGQNSGKICKNQGFWDLMKIESLVLTGNHFKWLL